MKMILETLRGRWKATERYLSTIINRDKRITKPDFDILSPAVALPLFTVGFMLLGIEGLTLYSIALFCVFIVSFLLGHRFSRPGGDERFPIIWRLGFPLFVVGAAAEIINIFYVGAVPLFIPSVRTKLIPWLSYTAFLIVPACIIKVSDSLLNRRNMDALFWFLAGLLLISLLGYRTEIFALLLGAMISAYYIKGHRINTKSVLRYGLLFLVIAVLINIAVVHFRNMPLASFMDRIAMTTGIFSLISEEMGLTAFGVGGGAAHASILSSLKIIPGSRIGPRTFISNMFGITETSTTPTILGLPFVDFGIAGIIVFGIILGLLYGSGYKTLTQRNVDILPVHALLMAFLILSIETGIADMIVILYLLAYLIMVI
jgi:oligosaccharide repeat unit polymerase